MIAIDCPQEDALLALASDECSDGAVRDHVEGCERCRLRVARLGAEMAALRGLLAHIPTGPFVPSGPPATFQAPSTQIGKYLVLDALGRGGQADVYRAVHPTLSKEVVIKLGREPCRDNRDALVSEGKVLAALDHPGLARVYDLDFHEDRPFLVMEYVPACDLRKYAEQNSLAPRRIAGLVARVARALAAAHDRGVVHQDLKPHNILVDESGNPRVIDFGLARMVHTWADPNDQPDGGTVAYMAPEQARGEADRVGPRSDLFALGAVLYFLLTGRAPFAGETHDQRMELASKCDFDRAALDTAPSRLRAICLNAMAADPADRPVSAGVLAAELERFEAGIGRRVALAAGAAAVVAAGLGLWRFGTRESNGGAPRSGVPVPVEPPQPIPALPENPLSFRLMRRDEPIPLNTPERVAEVGLGAGDELQIHATVPAGLHASLFTVENSGRLRWLIDGAPGTLLQYPPNAGHFVPLEGEGGTEVVFVCWRRSGPATVEELNKLWDSSGTWPTLTRGTVLQFDRERTRFVQNPRTFGLPRDRSDPDGEVRNRLERFRLKLRERFDHVFGVAFAYTK